MTPSLFAAITFSTRSVTLSNSTAAGSRFLIVSRIGRLAGAVSSRGWNCLFLMESWSDTASCARSAEGARQRSIATSAPIVAILRVVVIAVLLLEFERELELGAVAGEISEIERARIVDGMTANLGGPRRRHENLSGKLHVERRPHEQGVAGESVEADPVVVTEVTYL